jgi:hypothetical protein
MCNCPVLGKSGSWLKKRLPCFSSLRRTNFSALSLGSHSRCTIAARTKALQVHPIATPHCKHRLIAGNTILAWAFRIRFDPFALADWIVDVAARILLAAEEEAVWPWNQDHWRMVYLTLAISSNSPARARLNLRVTPQLMKFYEFVARFGKGQAPHMLRCMACTL